MLLSDGSTTQVLYRAMQFCQTHHLKPIAALLYRLNTFFGHAVIGRSADFGPGLVILHSMGIVVNSSVRAGKNLVLEHGITIGAEKGKSPVLGDNVFVGAGAKIIGDVHIGSDVKIGANAVVIRSLPDGATAVGIPAKVIKIYGERVLEEFPTAIVRSRHQQRDRGALELVQTAMLPVESPNRVALPANAVVMDPPLSVDAAAPSVLAATR